MSTVFLAGRFAVIHEGHARLIHQALSFGEKLVIGLQTKDYDRDGIEWRINSLKSISPKIEVVEIFDSIGKILIDIKPDILVKGLEFAQEKNEEEEILKSYGGRIVFASGGTNSADFLKLEDNKHEHLPNQFMERHGIRKEHIFDLIGFFKQLRVCVIGDLIIDEYISCVPLGMSQEEPVIAVKSKSSQKFLGGAGIVAAHCASLGAKTYFLSMAGDDESSIWAKRKLIEYGILDEIVEEPGRVTILKQRFKVASHTMFKLSNIPDEFLTREYQERIIESFNRIIDEVDLVIFSDFSYGTLSKSLALELVKSAKNKGVITAADCQTSSQTGDITKYAGVTLLTATEKEARIGMHSEASGLANLMRGISDSFEFENLILKLGSEGALIDSRQNQNKNMDVDQIPALSMNVKDVAGAGDSMLAVASMSFALGANLEISALLGSIAASIQVERIGNIPITVTEILDRVNN